MRRIFAPAAILAVCLSFLFVTSADAAPRKVRHHALTGGYAIVSQVDDSRYIGVGGMGYSEPVRGLKRAGRTVTRHAARAVKRTVKAVTDTSAAAVTGSVGLVAAAERHVGATAAQLGVPRSLWCSDFMNKIAPGHGTDRTAKSWARAGRPASRGCVGCVAVFTRGRNGGHVGVVKGWKHGSPILISGNFNGRVGVGVYPARRLVALRYI